MTHTYRRQTDRVFCYFRLETYTSLQILQIFSPGLNNYLQHRVEFSEIRVSYILAIILRIEIQKS